MPIIPAADMPYYDEIRAYAIRLAGNWSWGEDIAQETYLRFFQAQTEIQEGSQRAWLYRTARNLLIDQFRRNQRAGKVRNTLKSDILPARTDSDGESPQNSLEKEELINQVSAVVDTLPERQREVVRLKFQQQLSYEEISQVTGETKSTIGWLLHEAMLKLRKDLAQLDH